MSSVKFWWRDPAALLDADSIGELYPTEDMTLESKLNAVSRAVILIGALGYLVNGTSALVWATVLTLVAIALLYESRNWGRREGLQMSEARLGRPAGSPKWRRPPESAPGAAGTSDTAAPVAPVALDAVLRDEFHETTKMNPLGNLLLTEIQDNPNRRAAPPAFNPDVSDDIRASIKKQTQMIHSDMPGLSRQIYGDLADNFDLDRSTQRFYTMPNTRVANDQGSFANWLYGNMPSAKESNAEGNVQRIKDAYRYISP